MRVALFPGQGIAPQAVADALAGAPLLDAAADALGLDLRSALTRHLHRPRPSIPTELGQPALFVAGLASWERTEGPFGIFVGHSVGEYTALAAAGAFSGEEGVRLVVARGRATAEAARAARGGMAAVKSIGRATLDEICERTGVVVANDNSPAQLVIAGPEDALARAAQEVAAAGGRSLLLQVEGAFHTPAMAAAEERLRAALDHTHIRVPTAPVVSNVTALPYRAPGEIRKLLLRQLTCPIRFRECIEWAAAHGGSEFVDLGPGHVAGKLATATLSAREPAGV